MNAINDDECKTPLRDIDVRNIALRVEWTRRKQYGFEFPDLRGDITGPVLDQSYEMKRMVARVLRDDIRAEKERKDREKQLEHEQACRPKVVSIFHQKQWG